MEPTPTQNTNSSVAFAGRLGVGNVEASLVVA